MMAHPGKKLSFMGNEFGQLREWDERVAQDWFLLKYPIHDAFLHFMRDLNKLYLNSPAFWARDYREDGFRWTECNRTEDSVYAFVRTDGEQEILAVFNLSDREQKYWLPKPCELLLSSEKDNYGGSEHEPESFPAENEITMPRYSARYYLVK